MKKWLKCKFNLKQIKVWLYKQLISPPIRTKEQHDWRISLSLESAVSDKQREFEPGADEGLN